MKTKTYYKGVKGKKYGIYNTMEGRFQFQICEDTPMLAEARLHQILGEDAKKWRFEPRVIKDVQVSIGTSELQSCPFCGEAIAIKIEHGSPHYPWSNHRVRCKSCFAASGWFGTEEEAIEAWNRRTT
jgi:Lar family restriction alleviation protein